MRSAEGGLTRQRHVTSPLLRFLLPGLRVSKHPPPSEIMSHQTGIQGKSEIFLWFIHLNLYDDSARAAIDSLSGEIHSEKSMKMWINRVCQQWFHSDLTFTNKTILIIYLSYQCSETGRVVLQWSRAHGQRLQRARSRSICSLYYHHTVIYMIIYRNPFRHIKK